MSASSEPVTWSRVTLRACSPFTRCDRLHRSSCDRGRRRQRAHPRRPQRGVCRRSVTASRAVPLTISSSLTVSTAVSWCSASTAMCWCRVGTDRCQASRCTTGIVFAMHDRGQHAGRRGRCRRVTAMYGYHSLAYCQLDDRTYERRRPTQVTAVDRVHTSAPWPLVRSLPLYLRCACCA